MPEEFTVTPWEVKGRVDYAQLEREFGTKSVGEELIKRVEKKAGKSHFLLRRGVFYSHRDLDWFLTQSEAGRKVALYTGRGPSGTTHMGHLLPWAFTKYLQDALGCELYFQMTDDEKYLFKESLSREDTLSYAHDNALDLIALGFKPGKTHVIIDTKAANRMYPLAIDVAKHITYNTARSTFGFDGATNVGQIFFTAMQSATALLPTALEREKTGKKNAIVPTLIPCAIDQDPHFRLTRDVCDKLNYPKPAGYYCKFMPSLKGGDKMSASDEQSSISTTDTPEAAEKKIMRAFTGGRATLEEQRRLGGNPDVCSVCAYLTYFFEEDDKKLAARLNDYRAGNILDGENKAYLAEKVKAFLREHQRKREAARKVVEKFLWNE